jgi:5-methylcytosine-specific restriction endonuclease McrA
MKIIVLNADYSPINVTTFKKGFKLVYKGKAEVLDTYDDLVATFTKRVLRPRVIRLLNFVNLPYRKLAPTKNNIFRRDGFECGYCLSKEDLTLDHIMPKSRGGGDTWSNLVTCCKRCNGIKDNKTPEEAGMVLKKRTFAPTLSHLLDLDPKKLMAEIMAKAYGEG